METAAAVAATSELAQWRELGERVGLSALIVICIMYLLLKSGKFAGPLLAAVVNDFRGLIADLRSGHGEIKESVTTMASCMKDAAQSTSRLRAAVVPAARLLGMAASGKADPKEADALVEEIHDAVK